MPARPETLILQALLEAGEDGVVSGADLARRLGVSRVAVWQQLEKLRLLGFEIQSLHARGYRLATRPAFLHPALIEAWRRPGTDAPASIFSIRLAALTTRPPG